MNKAQEANSPRHYLLLTLAVVVGLAGVYLRFAGDAPIFNIVANILLVVGIIIALRAVFTIMK